jgi:hypothetical protein
VSITTIFVIVALVLALIHEFQAQGRDILGWAVVFLCIAALWGNLSL